MSTRAAQHGVWAFFIGFLVGLSSCSSLPTDAGMGADQGNDPTIVFSGFNQKAQLGYLFVRVRETALPSETLIANFPQVECKREACVRWQIIKKDGSFGLSGGVLKGHSQVELSLADVTGSPDPVSSSLDGEYQIAAKIYYQGNDGAEHLITTRGFIRVNVLRAEYQPIGCNDPAIAWEVALKPKGCSAQWTTLLRGTVCGKCGQS